MLDKKTANQRFYAFAVLVLSLIFSALFTVMVVLYYEKDVQFFKYKAIFPQIVCWLIFALTAAMLIKGFLDKAANGYRSDYNTISPFTVFGSILTGLFLLLAAYSDIKVFAKLKNSADIIMPSSNAAPFDLSIPIIIFTIISACYFLCQPFVGKKIRAVGIAFILRMVLYIVQGYFSKLSPLTSPVRILDQMACIAIMIYFVYEIRFAVSEDRPKHYLTFAPAAIFLTAISSISQLIGLITGKIGNNGQLYNVVLCLALLIYMISRYLNYVLSGKYEPVPEPVTEKIKPKNPIEFKTGDAIENKTEETVEEITEDTIEENVDEIVKETEGEQI